MAPVRRIHIIGGPGSGKSMLAFEFSCALEAPMYALDNVALEGPHFTARSLENRLREVSRIAAEPAWVTEGIWLWWTDELLRAADVIIWLDSVSVPVALMRIAVRFAREGWGEVKRQPVARKVTRFGDFARNLRLLVLSLVSAWQYYTGRGVQAPPPDDRALTRAATAAHLERFGEKVVHCRTSPDVKAILTAASMSERSADIT